jgi:anti-sigma factor (TIGR02949 family)
MDCEETLTELEAYLDRELSREELERVEAHLTGCSDCFDRSEFRVRIRTIVRRKCGATADLPPGLTSRIRAVIDATDPPEIG